ncbi:hypothetical protein [Nocardia sp. CA-119907]
MHAAWRSWLDSRLEDWDFTAPKDRRLLDQASSNINAKLLDEREGQLV